MHKNYFPSDRLASHVALWAFLAVHSCLWFGDTSNAWGQLNNDSINQSSESLLPVDGAGNSGTTLQQSELNDVDLLILTDVDKAISQEWLTEKIRGAFKRYNSRATFDCESVEVEPKNIAEYELLRRFIESPEDFIDDDFTPELEPHPEGANRWRIHLEDPSRQLAGIKVEYELNGRQNAKYFSRKEDTDKLIPEEGEIGTYLLTLDPAWSPRQYTIEFEDGGADESKKWPERRKKFLVKISGFKGGIPARDELFKLMADPSSANPIDFDTKGKPALFSNLNIGDVVFAGPIGSFEKNIFTMRMPALATNSEVKRLWLAFPLTREELDQTLMHLENGNFTPNSLAQALREGKVLYPKNEAKGGVQTRLNPNDNPTWFEVLPEPGGRLTRAFQIVDGLKWLGKVEENGAFYSIAIYEGESNRQPSAIAFRNQFQETRMWTWQELEQWPAGIRSLTSRQDR